MKKKKDQNICIRVDRDELQINRCKEHIEGINGYIMEFAQVLQLAGNAVRMKILILLREEERLCVCDLAEVLGMKIPAVSQHLRKLKDANLVLTEREGTTIFYFVNPAYQSILESLFSNVPEVATA